MKTAFLVLGYNNTRIEDVRKIRAKAKQHFDALTVLCKPNPTADDLAAVDHVIDTSLEGLLENATHVLEECSKLDLVPIGILPFSDPGTQLGAFLSNTLKLPGADPEKISAALNKIYFRSAESSQKQFPLLYRPVRFQKIKTQAELTHFLSQCPHGAFVKPAKEGNSRGCTILKTVEDITRAWRELEPYYTGGLIVEENISNGQEYSFDHVSDFHWITEKKTTQNEYRAEIQQIIPAPTSPKVFQALSEAGKLMADLSGSNGGACHNELFWIPKSETVSAVEPNLRPGGMKIWDLAAIAFESFDPWLEWLYWVTGKPSNTSRILVRDKYAGIRMIASTRDCVLEKIPDLNLELLQKKYPGLIEIKWTKPVGTHLEKNPKDNAGFAGFILAAHKNYSVLSETLEKLSDKLGSLL